MERCMLKLVSYFFLGACCLLATTEAIAVETAESSSRSVVGADNGFRDIWLTSAAGVKFVQPYGWRAEVRGPLTILSLANEDARLAVIDVRGPTIEEALNEAWRAYRPLKIPKEKDLQERQPRNGWKQIHTAKYEPETEVDRVLRAQALTDGTTWVVVVTDMPQLIADLHEAPVGRVFSSVRRDGYREPSLAGRPVHEINAKGAAELVKALKRAQADYGIPGIAFAVVQGGQVKVKVGLGVESVDSPKKVTPETRFLTASITKPLTSLMLAKLVDQGKMSWDTPVRSLLPTFDLQDHERARQIRVRNLLCSCTGVPAHDPESIFSGDDLGPKEILGIVSGLKPTAEMGVLYQYSNLMAVVGGYTGASVAHPELPLDTGYDRTMQELVFNPLGMVNTTFDFGAAMAGDYASPHTKDIQGRTVVADMGLNLASIPMRPDGGAWSTLDDLTRYLQMELREGLLADGSRYIGMNALLERQIGQVARGGLDQWYGMGLKTSRKHGVLEVTHGGSMPGYQTEMTWLPEMDAGYVLLTNADAGVNIRMQLSNLFLEVLLDQERSAAEKLHIMAKDVELERIQENATLAVPPAKHVVESLHDQYAHPSLGTIKVIKNEGSVWFDVGGWKSEVASDTSEIDKLELTTISPGLRGLRFSVSEKALIFHDFSGDYRFEAGVTTR